MGASVEGWGGGGQWVLVWRAGVGEDSGCWCGGLGWGRTMGVSVEGWGGGGQWVLVWRAGVGEDSGC